MTQTSDIIQSEHAGGVVCLTLNNGPVNALSADGLMQFAGRIKALEADDAVRAIALASPFKVFSAGVNLKQAQGFDLAAQHAIVKGLNEGFLALFECAKPTVVAVNGAAIAGGLFYVLASDFRIGCGAGSLRSGRGARRCRFSVGAAGNCAGDFVTE